MRENTVKKEAAVIQIIINLDYSSYLKGIPRNSSYCILPVGDGRTATGFMAPWRMNENRTISEPIPELKIKLSKGGDQNQNSFRDHKCSQQQLWPAVYKPGDIVRGVVETNFDSVTCDTKDGIWVIVQGVGVVHEAATPVAAGCEPIVVSGYGTLPRFWCLNPGERVEVYLKLKKALWQPSRLTSTWQTCTSSPPSETHVQPLSKSLFPDFGSQTLSTTRSTTVSATTKSSTTRCVASGNQFPAREKLRFECTLPAANLPQTFFGTYGKISYWIIALVQGEKPIWTMQKIVVLAKQGGEIAEEDLQKHEAFSDFHLNCCLRSKGVVEIVVKLPRIAFAVGECIPVTTEITNSTKYNITGCKLSLFQRIMYYCRDDAGKEEKRNVLTVPVDGNKPWSHQTRASLIWLHPKLVLSEFGSCGNPPSLIALDYWLEFQVKADSRVFETQRLIVPIKICTSVDPGAEAVNTGNHVTRTKIGSPKRI